jgi:sortase A
MNRAALAVACLVTLAGCGSSRASSESPATTVAPPITTTTTTIAATTTTSAPAPTPSPTTAAPVPTTLSTPVRAPADGATEPLQAIGDIAIARLGIDETMYEGITLGTLDHGPGHWPGSAMPGDVGNVVIAGHRVSHSRPFRYLDRLQDGDEVVFTVDGRRSVYVVTGHEIVTPDRVDIAEPTATPTATLFACHPPGSTRFRYVVHLVLSASA